MSELNTGIMSYCLMEIVWTTFNVLLVGSWNCCMSELNTGIMSYCLMEIVWTTFNVLLV